MMIFEQGQNLTTDEKAMLVMQKGSLISSSEYAKLQIDLYRVDEEFVEIWYNTFLESVSKIEILKNKSINPFLKYLKISSVN